MNLMNYQRGIDHTELVYYNRTLKFDYQVQFLV